MHTHTKTIGWNGRARRLASGLSFFLLLILAVFTPGLGYPSEARMAEVAKAAQIGLPHYLQRLPADETEKYGFKAAEKSELAQIGEPLRLYTITPDSLAGYRAGDGVRSLLTPTKTWYVPVVLNGGIRAILTVVAEDGGYRAVALGKAPLAGELNKVLKRWPAAEGYQVQLVAVFQANAYFFAIPQVDGHNLSPFIFEGKGFGVEPRRGDTGYSSPVDFGGFAKKLQAAVSENLRQTTEQPKTANRPQQK